MINKISFASMYLAIVIILSLTPQVGYITVGTIAITTIPIIIVIASFHIGWAGTLTTSIGFGIFSFIATFIFPSLFTDPVLLITPRILMAFILCPIVIKIKKVTILNVTLFSILTVTLNTLLVTAFLFVVNTYNVQFETSLWTWITLIYINYIIELSVVIVLSILLISLIKFLRTRWHNELSNKW